MEHQFNHELKQVYPSTHQVRVQWYFCDDGIVHLAGGGTLIAAMGTPMVCLERSHIVTSGKKGRSLYSTN